MLRKQFFRIDWCSKRVGKAGRKSNLAESNTLSRRDRQNLFCVLTAYVFLHAFATLSRHL